MAFGQDVYQVIRDDIGGDPDMTNREIVSTHADLASANVAARALARECAEEWEDTKCDEDNESQQYSATIEMDCDGDYSIEISVERHTISGPSSTPVYQPTSCPPQMVYHVIREDYDRDVVTGMPTRNVLDTCFDLETANAVAMERSASRFRYIDIQHYHSQSAVDELGALSIHHWSDYPEDDIYFIKVEQQVPRHRQPAGPLLAPAVQAPSVMNPGPVGRFGPMITIPLGRPLLRGVKFVYAGTLQTLEPRSFAKTVELYGGQLVFDHAEADYLVLGLALSNDFHLPMGSPPEQINEAQFYKLLQEGVPTNKILRHERLREISVNSPSRRMNGATPALIDLPSPHQMAKRQRIWENEN